MPKATSKVRNIWSDNECIILMQAIMNTHTSRQDLNSGELGVTATFWNQVSDCLEKKGLMWEPRQCKVKWKNLKARYKNLLHSNDYLDELGLMVKYVGNLQGLHPSRPKRSYPSPATATQPQTNQQNNITSQSALSSSHTSNINLYSIPSQPTNIATIIENSTQHSNLLPANLPTIEPTIPNTMPSSNVNDIGNITHHHITNQTNNAILSQSNSILSSAQVENLSPEEYSNLVKQYREKWKCNQDQQILLLGKLIDGLQKKALSAKDTAVSHNTTQNPSNSMPAPVSNQQPNNSGNFYQQPSNSLNLLNRQPQQQFNTNLNHFNHPNSFN